eukprot:10639146-Prorocentrum_lima.AAC.1
MPAILCEGGPILSSLNNHRCDESFPPAVPTALDPYHPVHTKRTLYSYLLLRRAWMCEQHRPASCTLRQ